MTGAGGAAMGKKAQAILLAGAVSLSLTGCSGDFFPTARDITNVQLMRTMALDQGEDGKLLVTVSGGVRPGDEGSEAQPPVILSWEADTAFSACLTIQTYGDGYVSYAHVGQCVISADASEWAIDGLFDFVERDFDMRVDTNLYVAEQSAASDILTEVASEHQSASDRLDSIKRDLPMESEGWPVTLRDLLIDLEDNGCAMVPVVELKEEEGEKTIGCNKMGWFREKNYGGTLTSEQSRAAAMLIGQAHSGAVELELSDGSKIGLRLTNVQSSWEPVWEGNRLTGAKASVNITADLAEQQGAADIYALEVQREMKEKLSEKIKSQLKELLELSQEENADFLHLRRTLGVRCPARYRLLEEKWEEWFPELELDVEVDSTIERSYDVNQAEEVT